jgi:hypothetical protein
MTSTTQPNAEMAQAYDRDHRRILKLREAASALASVLEDETSMKDAQEYIGTKLKLERRQEALEAVWN